METLNFDQFRDSFELITPDPSANYAGFEGLDPSDKVWWSDATQCLIERGDGGACCATVSDSGTVGLFDHCAAFIYVNHYLLERTADADPMGEELHHIARCFMGVYPWPQTDLSEWIAEHGQDINQSAHHAAQTIIERFFA